MDLKYIKQELANAFSDNNDSKSWYKWVEYSVMACLILNAVVLFLATYDSVNQQYKMWLKVVDVFTTAVFFIEVSLRIWVADLQDKRFEGVMGRVRYCLTPYGFIDVLSTYPSVLSWFCNFSPVIFKTLRVLRLLRIFRFMKAFRMLGRAIANKRQEIFLSLGVIVVITFMLSLVMFFVEHAANPERYANGMEPMVWSLMQYIGDPGKFAGNAPETFAGRVISCIVGILRIAVFAVPAGLVSSGFLEEIRAYQKKKANVDNAGKIRQAFQRQLCRYTKCQFVPIYRTIPQMQVLTRLSNEKIMDAIDSAKDLRLVNLAQCKYVDENPVDQLAVEHFVVNRPYGCCINRGSKVTIVETSAFVEVGMGNFAFYLAMIGGFNYISREEGTVNPYQSYYVFKDEKLDDDLSEFMEDLNGMAKTEDDFVFYVLAGSGGMEPKLPTQIHFNYGGAKGDETYDNPGITLHRTEEFEAFYQDVSKELKQVLDFDADKQRHYDTSNPNNIMRKLKDADKVNSVTLRVKWPFVCCDLRRYLLAKTLADAMHRHFVGGDPNCDPILKEKGIGFADYNIDGICEY